MDIETLKNINIENIDSISLSHIGVTGFEKIAMTVRNKDDTETSIDFINEEKKLLKQWLEENHLYEKAKLYRF